jgi:hypothetical protein
MALVRHLEHQFGSRETLRVDLRPIVGRFA